jgi:acyl-lipid omega-6 desaturase (Delta-12 desaturase)
MRRLPKKIAPEKEKILLGGSSMNEANSNWVLELKKFEKPSVPKVILQLFDTLVPYLALLVLMYLTMFWGLPYIITFLLAFPAGALLVRLFIFFHDCGHGSYVASPLWQKILGYFLGIFTFSCFSSWRYSHGTHHSTSGNLDRRGIGDVWTMTLAEYEACTPFRRLQYRLFRNPLIMFGLGPFLSFLVMQRIPSRGKKGFMSVMMVNAVIAGIVIAVAFTIGIKAYLLIQMPILALGGAAGVWLFYVQHQFDPSYWARTKDWGSMSAAMQGSSYYKLPKVLQWISGNIGFHHLHHLRPRIPNYNLEAAVKATPQLQLPDPLLFLPSLKSVRLKLWDEKNKVLLTFREANHHMRYGSFA